MLQLLLQLVSTVQGSIYLSRHSARNRLHEMQLLGLSEVNSLGIEMTQQSERPYINHTFKLLASKPYMLSYL